MKISNTTALLSIRIDPTDSSSNTKIALQT